MPDTPWFTLDTPCVTVTVMQNERVDWFGRFKAAGLTLTEPVHGRGRHSADCDVCGRSVRVTPSAVYQRTGKHQGCGECCKAQFDATQPRGYVHVDSMDYKQVRKAALAAVERDPLIDSRDEQIRRFDGLPCAICGEPIDYSLPYPPYNPRRMELDHVVPLSAGGVHKWSNVQPAHAECNRGKSAAFEDGSGEFAVVDGVLTPRKRLRGLPVHGPAHPNPYGEHDLGTIGYVQHCYLEPGTWLKREPFSSRPKLRELADDIGVSAGSVGCWVNQNQYPDWRHVYYAECAVDEEVMYGVA